MQFSGEKEFPQSPGELFAKLTDARFLVQCVPGSEAISKSEADVAVCTLRPGVSYVRGNLEVTFQVFDRVPEKSARWLISSKGIGSHSDVEATLTFIPLESGTRVHWAAEVKELGGLLKAIPRGLIQGSAQKVIGDVWAAVQARLSAST